MTLVARLAAEERIHELHRISGEYELRLYERITDADHPLTQSEAGEWLRVVAQCGGEIARTYQTF